MHFLWLMTTLLSSRLTALAGQTFTHILQAIQLATSIRQESPDKYRIDTVPLYKELIRGLDMNPDSIIRSHDEAARIAVLTNLMNRGQGVEQPLAAPESQVPGVVETPLGPVAGSPVETPGVDEEMA